MQSGRAGDGDGFGSGLLAVIEIESEAIFMARPNVRTSDIWSSEPTSCGPRIANRWLGRRWPRAVSRSMNEGLTARRPETNNPTEQFANRLRIEKGEADGPKQTTVTAIRKSCAG